MWSGLARCCHFPAPKPKAAHRRSLVPRGGGGRESSQARSNLKRGVSRLEALLSVTEAAARYRLAPARCPTRTAAERCARSC